MIVASTMVPVETFIPWFADDCRLPRTGACPDHAPPAGGGTCTPSSRPAPLHAQVDADEFAHGQGVVEGFFHRRIGEVEPVLEEVDAQHALKANRRASVSRFGVDRLDQAHSADHGTTRFISARNFARRVVLP